MNKKCRLAVLLLLLLITSLSVYAQTNPLIKAIRTTAYEAVQKDASWVKGKVIDNIHFVKYDHKGRMSVENILKPDGSPKGKIVYHYNENGQVEKEIYATAEAGGIRYIWSYGYDAEGRLNSITTQNEQQDTLGIVTAVYATDGKVEKKWIDDRRQGIPMRKEVQDTTQLKRESIFYMQRWEASKERKEVQAEPDEFGNWTLKTTYKLDEETPEYITQRDITYDGTESDLRRIPLQGNVKQVTQYSYVAVPKGPETVLRGEKKGHFFVYKFDVKGRKVKEETFNDKGIPTEQILYEYNEEGDLLNEVRRTTTGALKGRTKYTYDMKGVCRNAAIYNKEEKLISKAVYRYDLEGNRTRETVYGEDGKIIKDFLYAYDSYGQQIERKILKQAEGDTGVYPYRCLWNFQKRMTEKEILLPEGGRSTYTYKYNKKGEVVSGTEQPAGQPETKYIYKFYNDNYGNWKIRLKYVNDVPIVYEERKFVYYD